MKRQLTFAVFACLTVSGNIFSWCSLFLTQVPSFFLFLPQTITPDRHTVGISINHFPTTAPSRDQSTFWVAHKSDFSEWIQESRKKKKTMGHGRPKSCQYFTGCLWFFLFISSCLKGKFKSTFGKLQKKRKFEICRWWIGIKDLRQKSTVPYWLTVWITIMQPNNLDLPKRRRRCNTFS